MTFARLTTPLHWTANETVAGTGAIGGIGGLLNPIPFVRAFAKSWASMTETSATWSEAVALSKSIVTLSGGTAIVQNKPLGAIPGL